MKKGVSPFIASVLLIAFAVAVAGIYGGWFQSFINTITGTVEEKEEKRVECIYGGIALDDVEYDNTSGKGYLTGTIENTDIIPLGNIDLEIFYDNTTREKKDLDMELSPGERNTFNETLGCSDKYNCNYDKVRVFSNCSNVDDTITQTDITMI